jgi:hypothetical protein
MAATQQLPTPRPLTWHLALRLLLACIHRWAGCCLREPRIRQGQWQGVAGSPVHALSGQQLLLRLILLLCLHAAGVLQIRRAQRAGRRRWLP